MPWTAKSFAAKHNHKLSGAGAAKAARIATGMVKAGVPEGEAIATANARAEGKRPSMRGKVPGFKGKKTRRYTGF